VFSEGKAEQVGWRVGSVLLTRTTQELVSAPARAGQAQPPVAVAVVAQALRNMHGSGTRGPEQVAEGCTVCVCVRARARREIERKVGVLRQS
jgi:hypothetical protein